MLKSKYPFVKIKLLINNLKPFSKLQKQLQSYIVNHLNLLVWCLVIFKISDHSEVELKKAYMIVGTYDFKVIEAIAKI